MTPRRAFAFLWAFFTVPIVLGALVLLVVAITLEGRLFAIAVITLILAPSLAEFVPRARRVARSLVGIGLLALIACIVRAPREGDGSTGPAQVHFLNGTRHSKFSPATLVPEADQQILGIWLFGTLDPRIKRLAYPLRPRTLNLPRLHKHHRRYFPVTDSALKSRIVNNPASPQARSFLAPLFSLGPKDAFAPSKLL